MDALLMALRNIIAAVHALRAAEDTLIQAKGTDGYDTAADAYEDAHATLIIRENEAQAAMQVWGAGSDTQVPFDPYGHLSTHRDTDYWE